MDIKSHYLKQDASIREALKILEDSEVKIVLVVDPNERLVGTITDGDIRRAILRNISFDEQARSIISRAPVTMSIEATREDILARMQTERVEQMILVHPSGKIAEIKTLQSLEKPASKDNWVVLMAGGLGTRLRPLTEEIPKPMLKIGGSPILEILINNFKSQGFEKFYICINYRGDIIRNHFGDGSKFGVEIRYIEETKKLNTAGALSLIDERPEGAMFVINGDVITSLNFSDMLNFHTQHDAMATMAIREHFSEVPYGVVEVQDYRIHTFVEKPTHRYYVNAGIYLIEPSLIDLLNRDEPCSMPDLFVRAKAKHFPTFAFPVREYWMDVGRLEDYERANEELAKKVG